MPSNTTCAYGGCTSVKRKDPNLSFHRFPRDDQICRTWIARSGSVSLAKKSREKIENERICCKHFSDTDFVAYGTKGKRVLRAGAVPIDAGAVKNSEFAKTAVVTLDLGKPALANADLAERRLSTSVLAEHTYAIPHLAKPTLAMPDCNFDDLQIPTFNFDDPSFAKPALILDISTGQTITIESHDTIAQLRKKVCNDTPKERQLKRTIKYLRAEIKKKNQIIRRQDAAAQKLAPAVAFAKAAYSLNVNQLAFLKMQLNHAKKRQWSEDEKEFALSLYRKSRSAYNYLRDDKNFALPCVTLIQSWINEPKSSTGLDSGHSPN